MLRILSRVHPTPGTLVALALALVPLLGRGPVAAQEATAPPDTTPTGVSGAPTADQAALDREAEARLQAIFDRIDALEGVRAEVEAGVARLSGEAYSLDAREEALRLARATEGVVYVEDRTRVITDLDQRLRPAVERIRDYAVDTVAYVPLLLVAFLIVIAFAAVGRLAAKWEGGPHVRWIRNPFLRGIARQGMAGAFAVVGLLVALELLDATALVGAVLGTAGVFGLAVGFAFKEIVENHLAGVLLSLRRPFDPDDLVLLGGHEGKVVRLTARETILMTPAGNHVRIPNAEVFRSVLVNYTRNVRRRFEFTVSVGTADDLILAQETGRDALRAMKGVLDDPPPTALVAELGDSWVTLAFFGWVNQTEADFRRVRSEAIRLVKGALESAGVTMPSPEYQLLVRDREAAAPGAEGIEEEAAAPGAPGIAEAPAAQDVSPDRSLDEQIDEDRRSSDEVDLLSGDPEPG